MNYADLRNAHANSKIVVCGCGSSLPLLTDPKRFVTIGVNDVGRMIDPDYLVVVNHRDGFGPDRWGFIKNTKAKYVFTHIKNLMLDEPTKAVQIRLGKFGGVSWDQEAVSYTSNSPYIATIIAGYMGATKIGLIGVDFTKNHFFAETGEHSLKRKLPNINHEYQALQRAMAERGVSLVNLSPTSLIDIPRENMGDF